jgi:hypothetical protein
LLTCLTKSWIYKPIIKEWNIVVPVLTFRDSHLILLEKPYIFVISCYSLSQITFHSFQCDKNLRPDSFVLSSIDLNFLEVAISLTHISLLPWAIVLINTIESISLCVYSECPKDRKQKILMFISLVGTQCLTKIIFKYPSYL